MYFRHAEHSTEDCKIGEQFLRPTPAIAEKSALARRRAWRLFLKRFHKVISFSESNPKPGPGFA
jgi:hypothetical protein